MDWTQQVDGYCERLDPGLWAEPLNAVTNLAFLIAAFAAWRLVRHDGLPLAKLLVLILTLIGIGSGLFHTFATIWASLADTLPILAFILVFVFAASRDFLDWPPKFAVVAVIGVFPWAAGVSWALLQVMPGLGASAVYASVDLLIWLYVAMLLRRAPDTARALAIGAALLAVSITARALDMPFCAENPVGSHFLWHVLNAAMLFWMIRSYRGHMLAKAVQGG
ncbi:MAG: ceramidase domain-containing protein [Rhodobacteraceae bacterium]|nr:ceramidase domain-containing protein [Paracoccaceae bacterium]